MKKSVIKLLVVGAVALGATAAYAAAAPAQNQNQPSAQTPKDWSYDIKNGQRVPKGSRVTNADGSWREEVKQGNCVTVKEKSATGEYKETRQCNPG
jgi:Spy/CpxP family protein refolding chaperone